jgi:sulfite reductase (NADPH) flavoprotein alpha-component
MSIALRQAQLPDAEWRDQLDRLTSGLDAAALNWISGYTAALAQERGAHARGERRGDGLELDEPGLAADAETLSRATVLYGSQTGHGRRVAEQLGHAGERAGLSVRVQNTLDYNPRELAAETLLFVVMSTHGDGDPPDDARAFVDFLTGRRAPKLEKLAYSVLALGDSSYPKYCEAGRLIDERFAALGARRLSTRVDCDVDFKRAADSWLNQAVSAAGAELGVVKSESARVRVVPPLSAVSSDPTREHPLEVEVIANQTITGRGSLRAVHHLELTLPAGRLEYHPGDALGVLHENPPEVVDRVLELTGLDGHAPVSFDGRELPLHTWLRTERELTRLTRPFIDAHRARATNGTPGPATPEVPKDWQVADLLKHSPAGWNATDLVANLRALAPRLYSIASSRLSVVDEVHLTVAAVDYDADGERRYGSASRYLATRKADTRLQVYIERNKRFRLPADRARDVIMIGPGTGVAPFRGFLQERAATAASGRNWLFFGARQMDRDFLYQTEWQSALKHGALHRLDVAFSRDRAERVYVQQRMREQGAQLFHWLESGAYLYVCGDAANMAPDVHQALLDIVGDHGGRNPEEAADYLNTLMSERRYVRDVY